MAIAFILGGMIGGFWVLGIEFLDKTIKTTKDMENKLGLRVLGGIPEYNLESEVEE
jgi:capsular polysaccharide biosynthesis protein